MSDKVLLAGGSFGDQPFEELPLGELGIEELESHAQLSSTTAEFEMDPSVVIC